MADGPPFWAVCDAVFCGKSANLHANRRPCLMAALLAGILRTLQPYRAARRSLT